VKEHPVVTSSEISFWRTATITRQATDVSPRCRRPSREKAGFTRAVLLGKVHEICIFDRVAFLSMLSTETKVPRPRRLLMECGRLPKSHDYKDPNTGQVALAYLYHFRLNSVGISGPTGRQFCTQTLLLAEVQLPISGRRTGSRANLASHMLMA
jgi:hypothetical protein